MSRTLTVVVGLLASMFFASQLVWAGGDGASAPGPAKKVKKVKQNCAQEAAAPAPMAIPANAVLVQSAPPLVQVGYCHLPDGNLCTRIEGIKILAPNEVARLEQVYAVYTTNAVVTTAPLVYVPLRHP